MFEYIVLPLFLVALLLILALPLIIVYLFIRITEEAFEQVGFGHWHASLMVFGSILGSLVDIPLHYGTISSYPPEIIGLADALSFSFPAEFHPIRLSVNLGGCIIPLLISLDILRKGRVSLSRAALGTLLVAVVTYQMAVPVANEGIALPVYIPPAMAALAGVLLCRGYRTAPSLAYISGSMGTLLGADIMNLLTPGVLPELAPLSAREGALSLSIGGAGVFDGIFLTGVLAVLFASFVVYIISRGSCTSEQVTLES